ncbi:hypothetical protein SRHO_G00329630 [Serrasalmus rhombeus]
MTGRTRQVKRTVSGSSRGSSARIIVYCPVSVNTCSVEAALGSHLNCEKGKYVGLEGCLPTASQTLNLRYSESSSSGGIALVMLLVMGRETPLGPATAWSSSPLAVHFAIVQGLDHG